MPWLDPSDVRLTEMLAHLMQPNVQEGPRGLDPSKSTSLLPICCLRAANFPARPMQAVGTMSAIGLGRRFRPVGALATQLRAEEYLSQHIMGRPLYATASQSPSPDRAAAPAASQALPFDDNAHNRFHRQKEPLRNPLAAPSPPAASASAPAAAHQRPCRAAAGIAPQDLRRQPNKRRECAPEDNSRKGVLGARLRKQQQEQDPRGSAWRAQVELEERRAPRGKGPKGGAAAAGAAGLSRRPAAVVVSAFRRAYDEGRLPCSIFHQPVAGSARGSMVKWHKPPESMDTRVHLPLFLSGLLETKDPYRFLAIQGALDLIKARLIFYS